MSDKLDITGGNISRNLVTMAVPASVGFLFNTLYNVVDTYWGGRISTDALAALSLSFPVFLILLATGMGISSGASALIANALGSGDRERAERMQAQALSLSIVASIVLIGPILFALRPIFLFMGAEEGLLKTATDYSNVLVAGSIFFILNTVLNAGLTARGDTKSYRNFLIFGFFVNIGLDPLFMLGLQIDGVRIIPAMGVAGIAGATILIQAFGTVYLTRRMLAAGGMGDQPKLSMTIPRWSYWKEIASQGIPSALNMATIALGGFVITYFVARFGTNAVAGYGSALRIEQIALIPTIGLNIALATMVGQNNGAGRLDRVRDSYRISLQMGLVVMVGILTPVLLFGSRLIGLFTDNSEVISIGLRYLYIQALTFYSYVVMNQANSVLQGLKRPGMIMWVGLYRQVAAPFPIFWAFTTLTGLGVDGVWWGLVVVNWTAALFTLWWARRILVRAEGAVAMPADERTDDVAAPTLAARSAAPGGQSASFPCLAANGCIDEAE